jgi:endoglucanase
LTAGSHLRLAFHGRAAVVRYLCLHGIVALFLIALAILAPVKAEAQAGNLAGPALQRGVNLSNWFQLDGIQSISEADLRAVYQAGFDHVRIPVDPAFLGWSPDGNQDAAEGKIVATLTYLASLVTTQKLALIIDIHPSAALMERIEADDEAANAFVSLWSKMAAGLRLTSPDNVALEILNEPPYYSGNPARWPKLAARIVASIRASLPQHLLIVGGRFSNGIDGLLELQPLPDPNILYVFHFYDPFIVTHQGASWWRDKQDTAIGFMQNVPYPATLGAISQIHLISGGNKAVATKEIAAYAVSGWDREKIAGEIDKAASWARHYRVKLICTEFGVLKDATNPAARLNWLTDMREALERHGIGWSVFDLVDTFGIATRQGDRLEISPEMRRALGLPLSDPASGQP